jgi:hypothetical protein
MKIAPPEGISEDDYEAIEAAVTETVRGRWFLAEFTRRSRVDEMRQVLDAMARLEQVVTEQKALPNDPSIRLLVQRLKDVAGELDGLVADMRLHGQDKALCARVEAQARALGGLLRLNASSAAPVGNAPQAEAPRQPTPIIAPLPAASASLPPQDRQDVRLAALARLDGLPIAEKLALFS